MGKTQVSGYLFSGQYTILNINNHATLPFINDYKMIIKIIIMIIKWW